MKAELCLYPDSDTLAQNCLYCHSLFCLTTGTSNQQGCPGSTVNKTWRCKQTWNAWSAEERILCCPLCPLELLAGLEDSAEFLGVAEGFNHFTRVAAFTFGYTLSWKLRVIIFCSVLYQRRGFFISFGWLVGFDWFLLLWAFNISKEVSEKWLGSCTSLWGPSILSSWMQLPLHQYVQSDWKIPFFTAGLLV